MEPELNNPDNNNSNSNGILSPTTSSSSSTSGSPSSTPSLPTTLPLTRMPGMTSSSALSSGSPSTSPMLPSDYDRRKHVALVLDWLRSNYRIAESGSISKSSVFKHYQKMCEDRRWEHTTAPVFGKYVKLAFPHIKSNRKGPRGSAKHHYTCLQRITNDYRDPSPPQLTHTAVSPFFNQRNDNVVGEAPDEGDICGNDDSNAALSQSNPFHPSAIPTPSYQTQSRTQLSSQYPIPSSTHSYSSRPIVYNLERSRPYPTPAPSHTTPLPTSASRNAPPTPWGDANHQPIAPPPHSHSHFSHSSCSSFPLRVPKVEDYGHSELVTGMSTFHDNPSSSASSASVGQSHMPAYTSYPFYPSRATTTSDVASFAGSSDDLRPLGNSSSSINQRQEEDYPGRISEVYDQPETCLEPSSENRLGLSPTRNHHYQQQQQHQHSNVGQLSRSLRQEESEEELAMAVTNSSMRVASSQHRSNGAGSSTKQQGGGVYFEGVYGSSVSVSALRRQSPPIPSSSSSFGPRSSPPYPSRVPRGSSNAPSHGTSQTLAYQNINSGEFIERGTFASGAIGSPSFGVNLWPKQSSDERDSSSTSYEQQMRQRSKTSPQQYSSGGPWAPAPSASERPHAATMMAATPGYSNSPRFMQRRKAISHEPVYFPNGEASMNDPVRDMDLVYRGALGAGGDQKHEPRGANHSNSTRRDNRTNVQQMRHSGVLEFNTPPASSQPGGEHLPPSEMDGLHIEDASADAGSSSTRSEYGTVQSSNNNRNNGGLGFNGDGGGSGDQQPQPTTHQHQVSFQRRARGGLGAGSYPPPSGRGFY